MRVQAVRYVMVGASGYCVGMAVYGLGLALGLSPYVAVPPAFVVNGMWNFALNRAWCFPRSGRAAYGDLWRAAIVAAMSLIANYAVLYLLHRGAQLSALPAQALTVVLVTPVGFFGNKHWSFRTA